MSDAYILLETETNGCSDTHILLLAVINIGRLAIETCLVNSGSIVASNGDQFCAIWSIREICRARGMRRAPTYSKLRRCRHCCQKVEVKPLRLYRIVVVLTLGRRDLNASIAKALYAWVGWLPLSLFETLKPPHFQPCTS
jgi:hypothetical protein